MKPLVGPRRLSALAPAVSIMAIVSACGGGEEHMHPTVPTPQPVESIGRTNAQPMAPNTPTASSVAISADVMKACNIPDSDAYFAFDSSNLTAFDYRSLDSVATCFTRGPMADHKLSLIGHADPRGATEYNMTLGQSRADAVGTYLAARGLSHANMTTTSRGALDATGHEETGWTHDRRVDISLAK